MFRQATIFLLILTTLTANCSRFFVFAGFELNKKYIVSNLCENRNRPYLHCNGKCYFMKKIRQAEENEKKEASKDNLNRLEVSFFHEPFKLSFPEPVLLTGIEQYFPVYTYQYTSRYLSTIFRPPKQAA
ncbi:hypothetical protein BDD43_4375 [Mucilaginibacter gracilis]|uniref:Uncharacterized protein n=1 Tax=Mucilaginibacter gracilis TaxID=423350 RepID=A0A495J6V8_9SPHI|nr:hypothetical protein [Mucilaginibacter gracilis]RKR84148.1 hypothetical protein BDD43_4375 [Mucilaginibacter gracilis]